MRESKAYQAAKAMPNHSSQAIDKAKNKDRLTAENKAKANAFKAVRDCVPAHSEHWGLSVCHTQIRRNSVETSSSAPLHNWSGKDVLDCA